MGAMKAVVYMYINSKKKHNRKKQETRNTKNS